MFVNLEVTTACNGSCIFCPRTKLTRPRGNMSEENFDKIISKLKPIKDSIQRICFTGFGEPTLHRSIVSFVQAFKDWPTFLTTNGSCSPMLIWALSEAGLNEITFSVNYHTEEQALRIMGVHPATHSILRAVSLAPKLRTSTITVLNKLTKPELSLIWAWIKSLGVRDTYFCPCHTRGSTLEDSSIHEPIDVTKVICHLIQQTLYITWEGNILACSDDLAGESYLGNILTDDLESILERQNGCKPDFKMCVSCDDIYREATPQKIKEILLANGVQPEWLTWP